MSMRSASYPALKGYVLSIHFAKSSDSEIFGFPDNSKFSVSPEKVIPRQN